MIGAAHARYSNVRGWSAWLFRKEQAARPVRDLARHCITLRLSSSGGIYAWEMRNGAREVEMRVSAQPTFNTAYQMMAAAVDGYGLAFLPEDMTASHVAAGRLVRFLEESCPHFPGLYA